MPNPNEHKMTAEEFFKFTPENENERYELINGKIVAQAAPNIQHQSISMGLSIEIRGIPLQNMSFLSYTQQKRCGIVTTNYVDLIESIMIQFLFRPLEWNEVLQ